jgi:hypothetical protein
MYEHEVSIEAIILVLHRSSIIVFSYIQLKAPKEDHPKHKDLYQINSKHLIESTLAGKLNEFRKQKELKENDLIFLDYNVKPKPVNIRDVILKHKVSFDRRQSLTWMPCYYDLM